VTDLAPIRPLFILNHHSEHMGKSIMAFARDDYNKELGSALIDAKDDAQAISSFLSKYKDSPETLRSYAKEIERLLCRDHFIQYQQFLKQPTPKDLWCGPNVGRQNKDGGLNADWRPFVKGLGVSSINTAIKIIDSFLNYLVQTHYLIGNPLAVDRRRKKRNTSKPRIIDRYLELDEIYAVLNALVINPVNNDKQEFQVIRARYIILLLFYTGLRISEVANHGMKHFILREQRWFLRVVGKGNKLREIPVPHELLEALGEFRLSVGLPSSQPQFQETVPLVPMQNLEQSISARRIDQIIRWAFHLGAALFEPDAPRKASKLRSASAHWLRHSYVTYLLESGAPLKVAQENAGHSDVGTIMHYRHVAQIDRHAATNTLSLLPLNKAQSDKNCHD
jgi:site-specific recombinase XerD